MNLILKSRGAELTDRLRSYATEKLTRSQRFFDRIIKMEVELSQERNPRVQNGHRVEVTVKTPGDTLRAHGAAADFYAAIDQAAARLESQIKRFKGRLNHRSNDRIEAPPPDLEPAAVYGDEDGSNPTASVVRVPRQVAKPMTVEEAILELEDRGMQFLLFTDADTMDATVVYRRSDGTYGVIEHGA